MKPKTKKILIIVAVALTVLLLAGLVIWYFIIPAQFVQFWLDAWQRLNDPLPVVGVSVVMILVFAWNVFSRTSLGQRMIKKQNEAIARMKQENQSAKKEYEVFKNNIKELLEEKQKEIDYLKGVIAEGFKAIPNKKVKEIGEKVYGEETDSSTETKGL